MSDPVCCVHRSGSWYHQEWWIRSTYRTVDWILIDPIFLGGITNDGLGFRPIRCFKRRMKNGSICSW